MEYEIAGLRVSLPASLLPQGFGRALQPFSLPQEPSGSPSGIRAATTGRARGDSPEVARRVGAVTATPGPHLPARLVLEPAVELHRGNGWRELYRFEFSDAAANCLFGRDKEGFLLEMIPRNGGQTVRFRSNETGSRAWCDFTTGNHPGLFRFGVWTLCNLAALRHDALAIHASVILYQGHAVPFLGESGTGKSTHTRLWRRWISGSGLLNDDSPFIDASSHTIRAWGSPWSGKLPCYRNDTYPVAAFVRLSQGPENRIRQLRPLEAFGALFPSAPPALVRDTELRDAICRLLGRCIEQIPVYHLTCRPDADAARLVCHTLFGADRPAVSAIQSTRTGSDTGHQPLPLP